MVRYMKVLSLSRGWAPPYSVWSNCSLSLRSGGWHCHINQVKNTVRTEKWRRWKQDQRPGTKCQDLLEKLTPKLHNYTFFLPNVVVVYPTSFFPAAFSVHLRKRPLAFKLLIVSLQTNTSVAFLWVGEYCLDWTVRICPAVWKCLNKSLLFLILNHLKAWQS